jgi:hypothetical protein
MKIEKKSLRDKEEGEDFASRSFIPEIGAAVSFGATAVVCGAGALFYYDGLADAFSPIGDPKIFFAALIAVFLIAAALFLPKWLSRYTFDKEGVRLSVVGITRKFVAWERVKEVRYTVYGAKPLLFISENPLDGLSYSEIKSYKSQIAVICSARITEAVKAFYKEEIINYPKNSLIV